MGFTVTKCCIVLTLFVSTGSAYGEGETNSPILSENGVWEKTRQLYEQGLERSEALFRRNTNDTWRIVQKLYDTAKANGEDVPKDVMEWAKQDIRKIGAWEYKIIELQTSDPRAIETELNTHGRLRWQCYWIEDMKDGKRFYLRKAGRSYLRLIPAGDLLKLIPVGVES